jgi:hypothetical protein
MRIVPLITFFISCSSLSSFSYWCRISFAASYTRWPFARQLELLLAAVDQQRLEMPLHRTGLLAHRRLRDAVNLAAFEKLLVSTRSAKILKFSICMVSNISEPYYQAH